MNYKKAVEIISKHYCLPFPIDAKEAKADIEDLTRKGRSGELAGDELELTIKLYEAGYIDLEGFDLCPQQTKIHSYAGQIGA